MRNMRMVVNPSAIGPQIGARTHHQDHVMILHNFRVMKMSPRIAINGKLEVVVF